MTSKRTIYTLFLLIGISFYALAQEDIKREVKLYNPYKPTLSKENKINFYPSMDDTVFVSPVLSYSVVPNVFMPEYSVRTIQAARLEPDPLGKLYKSFLNVGFGNYFTPYGELSISSERSRNSILGFYARHNSSFGKVKLENEDNVNAGYMDNYASLYGTRLFRRVTLAANVNFDHIRRYAYGYDFFNLPALGTDKDSLRIDYLNPSAGLRLYSTRLDSAGMDFDFSLKYNFLLQAPGFYSHNPSASLDLAYRLKPFYASLGLAYDLFVLSDEIGDNNKHLFRLSPSISKKSSSWAFNVGADILTYSRDVFDDPLNPDFETKLYFYPDVRFSFSIIPSFAVFYVSLDGELEDNRAGDIVNINPWFVTHSPSAGVSPNSELFRFKPTSNVLRVSGGLMGSADEYTTYKVYASYTLFEDMLFFTSDTLAGRSFYPAYDDGELLNLYAEFSSRINDNISLDLSANYYNYKLQLQDHPWYKPSWDASLSVKYNLRNKILAEAGIKGLSKRYYYYGPSTYTGETLKTTGELPVHFSLNLGLEYRYTKILSFWTRLNNISTSRYFEYGFYPSQRFLFMAGFTYSL